MPPIVFGEDEVSTDDSSSPQFPNAKPGPYTTSLPPDQEHGFQSWVKQNKVPWQDTHDADYDMRGYYKALQSGDATAKQKLSGFDGKMHFPDTYKTPYHKTFSNESMYATPDAPHWDGERLIDKGGKIVADETPKRSSKPMDSTPVVFGDQDIESSQPSQKITFGEDEIAQQGQTAPKAPTSQTFATRPLKPFPTFAEAGSSLLMTPEQAEAEERGAARQPAEDVPRPGPKLSLRGTNLEAAGTGNLFQPEDVMTPEQKARLRRGTPMPFDVASGVADVAEGGMRFRNTFDPSYVGDPTRERFSSGTQAISGAMQLGTPSVGRALVNAPLKTLGGVAAGTVASEGVGAAVHGHVSPEAEEFFKTTAFFIPSALGTITGLRSGTVTTPKGKFSGASVFGGRAKAGVGVTPEVVTGRVKVGGTQFEVNIPRNGSSGEPAPSPQLEQAVGTMTNARATAAAAQRVSQGLSPTPPPPPTPGEQFGNKLSAQQVGLIARTIAEHPEEARNGLIEEAHNNLSQWITDNKGKVIIDGKVHIAKTPEQAQTLAAKLINDGVTAHDKATAEAAKVQEQAAATPEPKAKPAAEVKDFLAQSRPKVTEPQAPSPKPVQASQGEEAPVVPQEFTEKDIKPEKTVRLYRGEQKPGTGAGVPEWLKDSEGADKLKAMQEASGRWFTHDHEEAKKYAAEAGEHGRIRSIELPESEAQGYHANKNPEAAKFVHSTKRGQNHDEYFLPKEVAEKATFHKEEPVHEFASTQVNIHPESELGQRHAEAVAAMPEEHIGPNGKEETPHVTVRYGLKDDSDAAIAKIKEVAAKIPPFGATVGKTGSFPETKEGDRPIIAHVEKSPELNALRSAVEGAGEFKEDTHGEYKPHVTLGYVKPEHVAKYEGGNHLEGGKVPVDHITVTKRDGTEERIRLGERRSNAAERKRVADMKPEEMARELHTSRLDNGDGTHTEMPIPNGRAFHDAPATPAVGMSDADALKAFNDKFGYKAGNAILVAKAEAAKEAGLDAYHQKGDEFLYRGESPEQLQAGMEKARGILKNREFTVTDATGKTVTLKGVDFSYGTGTDLKAAESGLKTHKQQREASGERARGELRGITEVGHEAAAHGGTEEVKPQTFHESDIEHELPEGVPAKGSSGDVPLSLLHFDPKRFQYKLNVNEKGVTNLLAGQKFNQDLAGVVSVWRDPEDEKLYVVNGHHRAQLAKEAGQNELLVRNLDVATASEARAIGALQNIAEGRGTAIDAAKFFRDRGISPADLSKHGISLGEAKAAGGLALSKLDKSLFERVATGKMTEGRGVAIGQATDDVAQQEAIVKLLDKREAKGKNITDAMVAELARFVASSGNRTIEQGGLFGANQQIHSLALEKAEISAHIKGQIAKERRVFGSVATEDKAAALGQVKGQQIKAEGNRKISEAAAQAEEAYNKLSSHAGPVNDALDKAARELASGYHKPEDVKARAYREARDELRKAVTGSKAAGAERVQKDSGPGKGSEEKPAFSLERPAPTFFSKAERVTEHKLPNAMAEASVIPALKNAGVKDEEIKWLGLSDWLAGQKLVTKKALLEFIRQNNVQVKEVVKGAGKGKVPSLGWDHVPESDVNNEHWTTSGTDALDGQYQVVRLRSGRYILDRVNSDELDAGSADPYEQIGMFGSREEAQQAAARDFHGSDVNSDAKFSNYQLPGGENYRELLLTLPEKELATPKVIPSRDHPGYFEVDGDSGLGYFADQAAAIRTYNKYSASPSTFQSSHFDEPNVLAHIRFNDRVAPDGRKTLFIEEVQSDWHQKGRKQGYFSPQEAADVQAKNRELASQNEIIVPRGAVPDAPFKSTWHGLAMKRMLRYAAENGYDNLGWTTGEQQAARYDLSKHIDRLGYTKRKDGLYNLSAAKNGQTVFDKDGLTANALAETVGKDIADKIVNESPGVYDRHNGQATGELSGLDLKVGGQGMKGFYDKILPDFMNKYGKKWGAEVGETKINAGTENDRVYSGPERTSDELFEFAKTDTRGDFSRERAERSAHDVALAMQNGKTFSEAMDASGNEMLAKAIGGKFAYGSPRTEPVHSIPITPAMRDSVIYEGQPLFNLSKDELRDWAVAAGRRLKIEEMGDQGNMFGSVEKMYRLSTSKENSVAVTQSQLDSLKEQIPRLGGKRVETQNHISASLEAGSNGLFADRAPIVNLSKAARDVINSVGGFRGRFNGANMSVRNVRTIAARLAGDTEPLGEIPEGKIEDVKRLADTLRQAAAQAGNAGITFSVEGAPEHVHGEETFHAGQRQLGEGEVNNHLSEEAGRRLLDHPLAKKLDAALTAMGYGEDLHPVSRVAEIAAKIATDEDFFDPEEAADWMVSYFDELHQQHGEGRVANVAETLTERAQGVYNAARDQLNAKRKEKAAQSESGRGGSGNETPGGSLRESEASRPQEGGSRRNSQNPSGKADQGQLAQPPLFSRDAGHNQSELVQSSEFEYWFGDSKIVNNAGRPRLMYHGTDSDFTDFDYKPTERSRAGTSADWASKDSTGFFFTESTTDAKQYGETVKPVYVRMERPMVLPKDHLFGTEGHGLTGEQVKRFEDLKYILEPAVKDGALKHFGNDWTGALDKGGIQWWVLEHPGVIARMRERGYDGTWVSESLDEAGKSVFVLNPDQVLSADAKPEDLVDMNAEPPDWREQHATDFAGKPKLGNPHLQLAPKPAPRVPTKGDTVTLADGREGTVQYVHPEMNIARVKTEDGKTITVGLKLLKDKSGEAGFARLNVPSAVTDLVKAAREKVFSPAETKVARSVDDTLYSLGKQYDADVLRTIKLLKTVGPQTSPADQETIYHHKEDPSELLTQAQQQMLDTVVQPLMDTNSEMRSKLNGAGVPVGEEDDGYIHRVVQGKNNQLERAMRGKGGTGKGNVLSKSAASLKGRRMFAAVDEDGNRVVVHRGDGKITAFENGTASEFGKDKPGLKPGDTFNDKDGQEWTLKQATTKEIEANTGVRYYKNALTSTVTDYLQLRRAERANDALEAMKQDDEFKSMSFKPERGEMPPDGWRSVNLPQFNGYYFEPHLAETLDRFADELRAEPAGALEKVGNFMTASLVLNPARHIYNIGNHWLVERGVSGNFNPLIWPRTAKAGIRAIKAVMTQNDDFIQALDRGAPMMSHRQDLRELHKHMVESLLGYLDQHTDVVSRIAEAAGYMNHLDMMKGLYKVGQKMTWMSNDIFFLQSIYEKELGGMSFEDAAAQTAKHIPDYRIPPRVMNSLGLSKFMNSHLATVFSRYHYGVWKSYGQMLKEVAGKDSSMKDRARGLDHMIMLGLLTFVAYELWDKLLKHVTGDPKARMVRSGASSVPYLVDEIVKGNKPPEELVQGTFTPAVLPKTATEIALNRDIYSGGRVYDRHAPAADIISQIGKKVSGSLGPSQQVEKAERSETPARDLLAYQAGITFPNSETQSQAVRLMHELLRENMALTPDLQRELDNRRARTAAGKLTAKEMRSDARKQGEGELRFLLPHLSYSDIKKVDAVATPEEKEIIKPIRLHKALGVLRNNPYRAQEEGVLQDLGR